MLGGGQIRLYKILSKPQRPPRHTGQDVRLYRAISIGAIIYFVLMLVGYFVFDELFEVGGDPVFGLIVPAAVVLLVCWWTTDMAPRFARWSVILFGVLGFLLSIAAIGFEEPWNKVEALGFVVYFLVIVVVASRQLRAIYKTASATTGDERSVT